MNCISSSKHLLVRLLELYEFGRIIDDKEYVGPRTFLPLLEMYSLKKKVPGDTAYIKINMIGYTRMYAIPLLSFQD